MRFTLEQYATVGREAALAKDTNAASLQRQWAIHAIRMELEPDRILARAAYDRGYREGMVRRRTA